MPRRPEAAALALALGLGIAAPALADDAAALLSSSAPPSPPAPKRPAILFNRWQEDWSVLADPALRTAPFDDLKYIPLSSGDPKTYLSLGGGLRERFETVDTPGFGAGTARADSYVISRLEAHADLRSGPVQVFVQLQSDFAPGKTTDSPVDADRLDLEQGFVAIVQPVPGGVLKLRAGRQQFAFDLQRFVAARDGPNVRQSFDALWADYETRDWRLIGYWTQPVVNRDLRAFDDYSSGHNRFYGVRIERHVLGDNELSAYWSRYTNDKASYLAAAGVERRDVFDARFAGRRGAIDWDLEAMGQTGSVGGRAIRAWGTGARAGYTFLSRRWSPRLGLQVDAASGDTNPADRTLGTFNPLFPNGAYVTLAGFTGYANMIHVKPSLTVQPAPALTLTAAVAGQWRETTSDAVYTQPNVPVPHTAGQGGAWTGAYGQFRADLRINANLTAALEAVRFQIGEALRRAGGRDGSYLGLELKAGW